MSERRPTSARPVVEVRGLVKSYGGRRVIDGVSFDLHEGEILAVLGPNGAGKTTLLETIEGLRKIEGGEVVVLGHEMRTRAKAVQPLLGIQLQRTSLFPTLTLAETLRLYCRLYDCRRPLDDVLRSVDLVRAADRRVGDLSGGEFQRFSLCLATLNSARVLFLDEPSTGLDPHARRLIWNLIASYRERGASVILTTHYMEEAEALADRVGILHGGRLIALGAPAQLIGGLDAKSTIVVDLAEPLEDEDEQDFLEEHQGSVRGSRLLVHTHEVPRMLWRLLRWTDGRRIAVRNVAIRSADLEDLFVHLTSAPAVLAAAERVS